MNDMKQWALRCVVLFVASVCACSADGMKKLEFKDVQNFSVTESRRDGRLTLHISGLAFHSALAVGRIETTRKDGDLIIYVILVPARKGLSGRFDYEVGLPPGIQRVLFGEGGHQIWPIPHQEPEEPGNPPFPNPTR
ncbi:hypothetical protein [Thiohalomonas denitrificans]|uniref:hypothetical protein n=1 Tax=Thiohalomonas denitrificans TaxID=415747 RepID=UPI0026ECF912|nr:hypothetical protein [Thiohalomonas denitrificans]